MRIDSSAPTRIDLAGGTYDIWPLYLLHERAQTINVAISLRAHCSLVSRRDARVRLVSDDMGDELEAERAQDLDPSRLALIVRLVRHFDAGGVDVRTRSDSPVGAGIAGSSAMNVAVAAALAAWTNRPLTDDALLALVQNIEAQVIRVPTGAQDYRPAVYGGVSAVELDVLGVRRVALGVDRADLGSRLVLAYTGAARQSGINNWEVMKRRIDGDATVIAAFDAIRDAADQLRAAIERADWAGVASALDLEWTHRKGLAPGVTTPAIEAMLASARRAGALSGKVCGAGGGGCLVCLTPPHRRADVAGALTSLGAEVLPFQVESTGVMLARA